MRESERRSLPATGRRTGAHWALWALGQPPISACCRAVSMVAWAMPGTACIVIPDCPRHVTQRGNNREDVFFVDDDRRAYLAIPAEQAAAFGVRVQGYCSPRRISA